MSTLAVALAACGSRAAPTPVEPAATAGPATQTPVPAAATVNGEVIPAAEFRAQVGQYKASQTALGKTVTDDEVSKAVLEDLISQVLLAQGARAAGFNLSESGLQSRLQALATQVGGPDKLAAWESAHGYTDASFPVTLKRAVEAAAMRDKIVSAVPKTADQVHVQQILLFDQAAADSVLKQLQGDADFGSLALYYDPQTQGALGWFPKGYVLEPKIEQAAFALQVGQVSDVIQTQAGFHIIKVLERDPQHPLSPEAYLALQELALKAWVTQQRAAAKVIISP
jgi:parvulin-like peptidyl-prolyl isomerase